MNTIPVPETIEHQSGSVFDISSDWYEMGKIEVEESEDWEFLKRIISDGPEEYLKILQDLGVLSKDNNRFNGENISTKNSWKGEEKIYLSEQGKYTFSDGILFHRADNLEKMMAVKIREGEKQYYIIYMASPIVTGEFDYKRGGYIFESDKYGYSSRFAFDVGKTYWEVYHMNFEEMIAILKHYNIYMDDCFEFMGYDNLDPRVFKDFLFDKNGETIAKRLTPQLIKYKGHIRYNKDELVEDDINFIRNNSDRHKFVREWYNELVLGKKKEIGLTKKRSTQSKQQGGDERG